MQFLMRKISSVLAVTRCQHIREINFMKWKIQVLMRIEHDADIMMNMVKIPAFMYTELISSHFIVL